MQSHLRWVKVIMIVIMIKVIMIDREGNICFCMDEISFTTVIIKVCYKPVRNFDYTCNLICAGLKLNRILMRP